MDNQKRRQAIHIYTHQVQYYETDRMKVVHHSNYIRWMEEARLDHMAHVGLAYNELEDRGIVIPAISVSCEYKASARYGETVRICSEIEEFGGLKFFVSYRVTSMDGGVLYATGHSSHCFLNAEMKPINIKKTAPEVYDFYSQFLPEGKKIG